MGLLKLLTYPISGPIGGVLWIAETIQSEAERQFYDEGAIVQQLEELNVRRHAGELQDEDYERMESELLERLLEAQSLRRGQDDQLSE
jgi:hypothetical protein